MLQGDLELSTLKVAKNVKGMFVDISYLKMLLKIYYTKNSKLVSSTKITRHPSLVPPSSSPRTSKRPFAVLGLNNKRKGAMSSNLVMNGLTLLP